VSVAIRRAAAPSIAAVQGCPTPLGSEVMLIDSLGKLTSRGDGGGVDTEPPASISALCGPAQTPRFVLRLTRCPLSMLLSEWDARRYLDREISCVAQGIRPDRQWLDASTEEGFSLEHVERLPRRALGKEIIHGLCSFDGVSAASAVAAVDPTRRGRRHRAQLARSEREHVRGSPSRHLCPVSQACHQNDHSRRFQWAVVAH